MNRLLQLAGVVALLGTVPSLLQAQPLVNGGFEADTAGPAILPSAWSTALSGALAEVTTAYANSGSNSLLIDCSLAAGWSSPNVSQSFAATPGQEFNLQGYLLNPAPNNADGAWGLLKIEFKTAAGANLDPASISIGLADGAGLSYSGAISDPRVNNTSPTDSWFFTEVQAVAPIGTATVHFYLLNVNPPGATNVFYYDDIVAAEILAPEETPTVSIDVDGDEDVTLTLNTSKFGFDYLVETSPDLNSANFDNVLSTIGGGTGGELVIQIPNASQTEGSKTFFRVYDVETIFPPVADGVIIDNAGLVGTCPDDPTRWSAFATFEGTPGTLSSDWLVCEAPFTTAAGAGTFSMNTSLATADPSWAEATQNVAVFQPYWAPENTSGGRPLTPLYGKNVTFSGTYQVTQAYGAGNVGRIYIALIDATGALISSEGAILDLPATVTGPTPFSLSAFVPSLTTLDNVQVGFRNTGTVNTAGTMKVSDLNVAASDLPVQSGEILFNGNFNTPRNRLIGWEAFASWEQPKGTYIFGSPWALAAAPVTADGLGTAVFGMNTQLATEDPFWHNGFQNPMSFQQVIHLPDYSSAGNNVANVYGQTLTFFGELAVTEDFASGVIAGTTNDGGTAVGGPLNVTVAGLSGSLSGTGASIQVVRGAGGDIGPVTTINGGSGFVAGETITIPGSAIGGVDGTDDLTVTVASVADSTTEIFIEVVNSADVVVATQVLDRTAQTTGDGVVDFSLPGVSVPASGIKYVIVGFRNRGIESSAGEIEVSNLSLIAAP